MNIYYDENMPFAAKLFAEFGEVKAFAGRQCDPQLISDADVLLVRSITTVDRSLLQQARQLQFVGTATIGTDHVDKAYLAERGITFTNAPGCNALSVAQYVLSAIKVLEQRYQFSLVDKTVGIIGAGNTGSRLAEALDALGVNYLLCDPLLAAADDPREWVDYEQLLAEADILSFHVPLVDGGSHPTRHLFGRRQLAQIKPDAVIINACRGEVVDNHMLLQAKQQGNNNPLVLDVWEGEPQVLMALIEYADIATAHIAGHSDEGKARGTFMLYQAWCQYLGVTPKQRWVDLLPLASVSGVSIHCATHCAMPDRQSSAIDHSSINRLIHLSYDVRRDDGIFRHHIGGNGFDWIRKHYPARREFSALTVNSPDIGQDNQTLTTLANLGFTLGE